MSSFGTDGIRGNALEVFTSDFINIFSKSFVALIKKEYKNGEVNIIIGNDTRISKDYIRYQIAAILSSYGINITLIDVTSTPALSYITEKNDFQYGIMISASHNPFDDNGIKIFDENGIKISEKSEKIIEDNISRKIDITNKLKKVGIIINDDKLKDQYIDFIINNVQHNFDSKYIIVDLSNGSACKYAKSIFSVLNAKVEYINDNPDGLNINKNCGSTHLNMLKKVVKKNSADYGIAYDGDADRCLLVTNKGNVLDGDYILALLGTSLMEKNELKDKTIVSTKMANAGLVKWASENNINLIKTDVGDKYIIREMDKNSYNLGGEQSGHIILSDYLKSGDGILVSLLVANQLNKDSSRTSDEIINDIFFKYPQTLVNIKTSFKDKIMNNNNLLKIVEDLNSEIGDEGQILLRASGTEPLIRIMVEASSNKKCNHYSNIIEEEISKLIKKW